MATPGQEISPSNTTTPSQPREGAITFTGAEDKGIDDIGNTAQAVPRPESKSDDDTITAVSDEKKYRSSDEAPATYENIKSGPEASRKKPHLQDVQARGPSKHFNPTNVKMQIAFEGDQDRGGAAENAASRDPRNDVELLWRARDNRKGRGSIAVPASRRASLAIPVSRRGSVAVPVSPRGGSLTLRLVFPLTDFGKNIFNMFTSFPYWDMAFWSGWSYSIGSVLFVIDGAWSFGPLAFPSTEWAGEGTYGVPLCFFFGALFYQVGATMAYFEAINDGSFAGSAMKKFLQGHETDQKALLDEKLHEFFGHVVPHRHHDDGDAEKKEESVDPEAGWKSIDARRRSAAILQGPRKSSTRRGGVDYGETEEGETKEYVAWRWWPTWHRLRTHHIYELGYVSCAIQLFGATLYGMCGVVALPGILDSLKPWQENAAYWIPQIVASVCFLTAGFGFTLETQNKWYRPEPGVLGWWIGAWATVGSVGFLLCGALGPASYKNTGAAYQSDLSSMWGSAAYLLSSVFQWYEAVNKHEVSELLTEQGELKESEVNPPNTNAPELSAPEFNAT